MTFQKFMLGLVAAFGLPWLLLIVVPYGKMSSLEPVAFDEEVDGITGFYESSQVGRVPKGSEVYGANGCYVCHTQVIRPTYAGSEMWRDDWAGQKKNSDDKDTRRESNPFDYSREKIAHIGLNRVGQDLSNVGYRIEARAKKLGLTPEQYIYQRLLQPRSFIGNHWSTCPSQPQLFDKADSFGQNSEFITIEKKNGSTKTYVPNGNARALAGYLLSLKKDNQVPASMSYAPTAK